MTRKAIIDRTLKVINQLPEDKAEEISVFADFVMKRFEEQQLNEQLLQINQKSNAYEFLNDEEDIYSVADLKEIY
ncbi:MAG: hypothetical protein KA954_15210 [Chitinophagales bacterium]|nr:hypothetical protein [Chitinophagales bacterium]MBP8755051.1 hypothetical protein [Chitinophagales bacterium]MBP9705715.1 hypothetical protein [Chitinophagales bacterium]